MASRDHDGPHETLDPGTEDGPAECPSESDGVLPVSVVIPTLGGPSLLRTIQHLNASVSQPAEILVCVPEDAILDAGLLAVANVRILALSFRGQVRQRLAGFRAASQPLVLQLDDDVLLTGSALHRLVDELTELGDGHCLGPVILERGSSRSFWSMDPGVSGCVASFVAVIFRGAKWGRARMGTISRLGHNYGVDSSLMDSDSMRVDWLPGGCVLHHRESLLLQDYFPFPGKAYAEDLMHSWLLAQRGIELRVSRRAFCEIEREHDRRSLADLRDQLRAVRFAATLRGSSPSSIAFLVSGYLAAFALRRVRSFGIAAKRRMRRVDRSSVTRSG